jgi:SAM-dependent methyltransferase
MQGYDVFLPQEQNVNDPEHFVAPTPAAIFRADTQALLASDLLVACLDQETVDCGVACEIGIAHAWGMPIVGLYTDIRQHRHGPSRMYKNPYILGAIEKCGQIVADPSDLPCAIERCLAEAGTPGRHLNSDAPRHFGLVAHQYSEYVRRLESWYQPPWHAESGIKEWIGSLQARRVLEYGCGPGNIGAAIVGQYPNVSYMGYDASPEMVAIAAGADTTMPVRFTTSWSEVEASASADPFDLGIMLFSLHDHTCPTGVLSRLEAALRPGGSVLVLDLCSWDLPRLTEVLRVGLTQPARAPDRRLNPCSLMGLADACRLDIVRSELVSLTIAFPSASDVREYLRLFGVLEGMDLPLQLHRADVERNDALAAVALNRQSFPFQDHRAFISCLMKKRQPSCDCGV